MPLRVRWLPGRLPGTAPDAPRRNALVILGYLLGGILFAGILYALV